MKQSKNPKVTVVMPVKNAGKFLREAINSVQNQTYKNWELIAVDNFSTDNTWEQLQAFAKVDSRVKAYRKKGLKGVSGAANYAISKAKGLLIARMDADDICHKTRLEKQVKFLQEHPEVVAVGTQCDVINDTGKKIGVKRFPESAEEIRKMIFWSIPLQQPSIMVRRKLLPKRFKWYEESFDVAEEVELLFKLFKYGAVHNLPNTLLSYRIHNKNISLNNPKRTFYLTLKARAKGVFVYGYRPTMIGILYTISQTFVISLLPKVWIYPLYSRLRSIKSQV